MDHAAWAALILVIAVVLVLIYLGYHHRRNGTVYQNSLGFTHTASSSARVGGGKPGGNAAGEGKPAGSG
jgi:hypothetical protein